MKPDPTKLEVIDLGLMEYGEALSLQQGMVQDRIEDRAPDRLLLMEHPPVITVGRSGSNSDVVLPEVVLIKKHIAVCKSDRGGKTTYHGPGQLVACPIIKLRAKDVHWYVDTLLHVAQEVIGEYGLNPTLRDRAPGVWVQDRKIASLGISMRKWVTSHGIALNVNVDLDGFDCIVPCGAPGLPVTSMARELGGPVDLGRVRERFVHHFKKHFDFSDLPDDRHPGWLTVSSPDPSQYKKMQAFVEQMDLETVCQSAHCPNIGECYSSGTATFMILGRTCTRRCRFCTVEKGTPLPPDPQEPGRVAKAVQELGLHYAVITSVTRDDLQDGGADQFVQTIRLIRTLCPDTRVEILVPDFQGLPEAIERVCSARPDMFNHNLETVARLYPLVRPQARYNRSLDVLSYAAGYGLPTKSGLMLGLGESRDEVMKALEDLRRACCEHLTLGQYLAPSRAHLPVSRYVCPEEFEEWGSTARALGFKGVASGPLVRSSYRAEDLFQSRNCMRIESKTQ